ncbi:MAG: GGDEF domain-containing protein [Actinomycetota bacterium]|nr:GGDEF domain-containing protein [Actinomycetota bacterium]
MDGPHGARIEGSTSRPLNATGDVGDPDAIVGLGLIVRDLARALGAEIALLAVPGETRGAVEVLAAWGAAAPNGTTSLTVDGFVARALKFAGPAVEPIDGDADGLAQQTSGTEITHALAVPVRPLTGAAGVVCAAFSANPQDMTTTLWLAESYARLAALCMQDPEALAGLLSGDRRDGLTGCLTQAAFLQELRRELTRSHRYGRPLSCCFIDLDDFKRVNDRYGHLHGSRVLARIATVLGAGIRNEDTLGRYGGDEFVVLLPDTDEAAALELSSRLRSRIARTMVNLPHDPIDASIGVAEWRPGSPLEALLWAADEARLAAKAAGGGMTIGASGLAAANASEDDPYQDPASGARPIPDGSGVASVEDVLDVAAQFDELGGASVELMAWELDVELARVVSAWSRALKQGYLEPAGTDKASGEEMWRLSAEGRRARGA